jgi:cytochrome P450
MLRSQFSKSVDFPLERIGANAAGLLIGSVETTSQAVAQILEFLVNKPDLLAKAKISAQAENPSEIDNIVWEALRFVPISPYLFRQTSENVVIAKGTDWETEIRAGTNVLLLTQSAMFDDYAYSNADIFSPERSWYHHFNYGFGIHDCLGKYIGMVMIPEMVRQVLLLNNLSELYPLDRKGTPFPEQYVLKWSN